jgi:hypothetical protein
MIFPQNLEYSFCIIVLDESSWNSSSVQLLSNMMSTFHSDSIVTTSNQFLPQLILSPITNYPLNDDDDESNNQDHFILHE